jgi:hypothetical protein
MRRRRKIGLVALGGILVAAVVVFWPRIPSVGLEALTDADRFVLLSLDPVPPASNEGSASTQPVGDTFHGYRILGQTVIRDPQTRRRLIDALRRGATSVLNAPPLCFNPRHGIRVSRNGETTDFTICFECEQAKVWRGDQRIANWMTDRTPQSVFDEVLKQDHVPLATPAE